MFTFEGLDGAKEAYSKLKTRCLALDPPVETDAYYDEFLSQLANDLNTANALTVLYKCLNDKELSSGEKAFALARMDEVLQLGLFEEKELELGLKEKIEAMVEERNQAKLEKDYAKADKIRDELIAMGVSIKDSKDGTTWALN